MFDDYFEVFLADTEAGKKEHYNLRYKVYCEEKGFEDKNAFPAGMEVDEWDDQATHFIVRLKHTKQWVGAMRLVHKTEKALPIEGHSTIEGMQKNDQYVSEVSRLCLLKQIRNPAFENSNDELKESDKIKLFFSHSRINRSVIWGLLRAATVYSKQNKIKDWYFFTSKALARVISKSGFIMNRVGEASYHNGERFPFRMRIADLLSQAKNIPANDIALKDYDIGYRLYSELEAPSLTYAASV
jgi:N-acyl amino acid synthase of PEP-CTERM/exosortase system